MSLQPSKRMQRQRRRVSVATIAALTFCILPLALCWPAAQPLPRDQPSRRRVLSDSEAAVEAQKALNAAVSKVAVHNTVILTQTNCGFLPFAENWLYHIDRLNLTNYIIIAEDTAAKDYIEARHAGHVVSSALLDSARPLVSSSHNKFQDFGSDQFIQLACARPVYLAAVLRLGFNVLWIDLDAALLIDPFKHLPWLYEYVGVDDHIDSRGRDSDYLCTCFMFMRPTGPVRDLLSEWQSLCEQRTGPAFKPGHSVGNQQAFNEIMRSRQNATVALDYYILPQQLYPNGWHMRREQGTGCSKFWRAPAWSHANYISGFEKKRKHFQEQGLWHGGLADTAPQC